MKLGAERKKVAILGVLLVIALLVFLFNGGSGSDVNPGAAATPPRPAPTAPAAGGLPAAASPDGQTTAAAAARGRAARNNAAAFTPSLGPRRGAPRTDPGTIDPTLRLDVLARLQKVEVTGPHRSVFDFGQVPPPVKPDAPKAAKVKVPSPIVPIQPANPAASAAANAGPPKPQVPPVPFKFFGYVNPAGQSQKRAFFTEGDEIHVVTEGELVKRRYRIVRIGVNSVIVEDTQFPGSQQTLPLEEQGG